MSKPQIQSHPFGHTFTWEEEQVTAKVALIRLHKAGNVTAEVEFSTTSPHWDSPFLHRSHLNLSSATTMKQTAKYMSTRYEPDILLVSAWEAMIEQLCYQTINLTRIGEEAYEVWPKDTDISPPEYVLYPLLQKNQVNLLFGDRGAGKTQVALLCAAVMGLPWYDNPFGFTAPAKHLTTLWLDWETDQQSFTYLYHQLQLGLTPDGLLPPIHYRHCRASLPDDIEQIAHWVGQTKADLLVIDHVGLAAGGPLNDDITATGYFNALRQLDITSLHLAHQAKDPKTKKKSVFGSAFWENIPRTIWELRKIGDSEASLEAVLVLTKRNIGIRPPPIGLQFSYNGAGTSVERFNPDDIAEFVVETSTRNQITQLLKKEGKLTAALIAVFLEIKPNTVFTTLRRMASAGVVVKVGDEWGLAARD